MGNNCTQQGFQHSARKKSWVLSVLILLSFQISLITYGQGTGTNILTYAGGSGNERFQGVLQLSDGTLLIGGQADNFSWLPVGTTVNQIPSSGDFGSVSNQGSGFIMHVSADQQVVLSVLRFPDNTVRDVYKIKTNSLPGQPTGDIFISGSRDADAAQDGYYIARLNNNFVNGQPSGLAYYKSIEARTRNGGNPSIQFPAGNESAHKQYQIWDVNAKGQILYATGNDFSFDKVNIGFMNRNGVDTLMNYFNIHNPGFTGVPATSFVNSTGNPAFDLISSTLSFRYSNTVVPGAMRSYSNSLFNQVGRDENGNIGRKGAFPLDAFFDSPQYLGGAPATTNGPGYTGYSVGTGGGKWTGKIGGIVFDKRNGHFYIGFSISVTSASNQTGLDDTEPALAACNENGELKWWARLHKEDGARSSAQQQVEGIDFDYSHDQVVVLGRTRGNSQNNFWKGNELKANKTGNGFQNQLTGAVSGPVTPDYFWIGKYNAVSGIIHRSTYVGELQENQVFQTPSSNPNLDGFPDLNKGDFNLGSTTINQLSVHPLTGQIYVCGTGQRTITTRSAYQKMLKPGPYQLGGGVSSLNAFARVYSSGLDSVVYSSLVTGIWNPANGVSDNTVLRSIFPIDGGLLVTGYHKGTGGDLILANAPAWGSSSLNNSTAVFGKLFFNPTNQPPAQPDTIAKPSSLCSGTEFTFSVPAVAGASSYRWIIEANGWTGSSTTNSITLTRAAGASSGFLTVYAINGTGVSRARTTTLQVNATVNAPTSSFFPPSHCPNQTLPYQVNQVDGATTYSWTITGTGCQGWNLSSPVTGTNIVNVTSGVTSASSCSLQVVVTGCSNSSSPVQFPISVQGNVPSTPVFTPGSPSVCVDIPKNFSVIGDPQVIAYQWTVSGTGYSGSSSTSNITVKANPGATGGQLSVVAVNQCGASSPASIQLGSALNQSIPAIPSSITGSSSGFCSDDTISYSTSSVAGNTYSWYTSGNTWEVLDQGTNTTRLFVPQAGGSVQASLFVQAQNECGISNPQSVVIRKGVPDILPAERILPSLNGNVCSETTLDFFINPTLGATSYSWSFPSGWTINGASNSNTVSVTVSASAQPGSIVVKSINGCGFDSLQRTAPTINSNPATFSIQPSTGNSMTLCSGGSVLANVSGTFTGAVNSFQWILPAGVFVQDASTSSPSMDTVRISTSQDGISGPILVYLDGDQCGSSTVNLSVTPNSSPGLAQGATQLCSDPSNQTYSVDPVAGATSYEFEVVPSNAGTISTTANSAVVDWNNIFSGVAVIRARAVSACGNSSFGPPLLVSIGLPPAGFQSPPSVCGSAEIQLVATGGETYFWYTSPTINTPFATNNGVLNVTVSSDTTFYVTISNGLCESSIRTAVNVPYSQAPNLPTVTADTVCAPGQVSLNATGSGAGASYNWYSSATGGSVLFTGSNFQTSINNTTTYFVSAGQGNCESVRVPVTALLSNNLILPTAADVSQCVPGSVTLTASGAAAGQIYNWYTNLTGGSVIATGSSYVIPNLVSADTFYVSIAEGLCESSRVRVIAKISNDLPTPGTTPIVRCFAGNTALTATGALAGQSYKWYDAPTGGTLIGTGSPFSVNVSATSTYYVAIAEGSCESSVRQSLVVTMSPFPISIGTNDVNICGNGLINLTGNSNTSGAYFVWFDAEFGGTQLFTGNPFNPTLTQSDTFYVQAETNGGCLSPRAMAIVTINPVPATPTGSNVANCGSGSVQLTASQAAGLPIQWYNAPTGGTLLNTGTTYTTPVLNATTSYYLSSKIGVCESPRLEIKAIISESTTTPTGANVTRCGNGSVDLAATPSIGADVRWYDSQVGGALLFTGTTFSTPVLSSTTSYYASSYLPGCESDRQEIKAVINSIPSTPSISPVTPLCGPGSVTLTATGGNNFTWFDSPSGGIVLGTGDTYQVLLLSETSSFYVSSSENGCSSERASVSVVVSTLPTAPLSDTAERCGTGSVTLTTSSPGISTFRWYSQATGGDVLQTGAQFTTDIQNSVTFFASSVDEAGCESSRTECVVQLNPIPGVPVSIPAVRCGPGLVTLTASSGAGSTVKWYSTETGGSSLSTDNDFQTEISSTSSFYVSTVDAKGCESGRTITAATVNAIPVPEITSSRTKILPGETVDLTVNGADGTYSWSPAATLTNAAVSNPVASPVETTTYKVIVTKNGCSGADSVLITVGSGSNEIPNVFTPNNDGTFDTWIIPGADDISTNKLTIFNRWGNIVKEFSGYKNDWDGDNLPAGTYYYTYDDGKSTRTGTVTLVR
jgi:gliding motility-associated-like protein